MKECITFKHVLNIDKYMCVCVCVCGERERETAWNWRNSVHEEYSKTTVTLEYALIGIL